MNSVKARLIEKERRKVVQLYLLACVLPPAGATYAVLHNNADVTQETVSLSIYDDVGVEARKPFVVLFIDCKLRSVEILVSVQWFVIRNVIYFNINVG